MEVAMKAKKSESGSGRRASLKRESGPKPSRRVDKTRSSSVERAFKILEELGTNPRVFGLSLKDLRDQLKVQEKIPSSTLSNLLHTLTELGYLRHNRKTKLYSLGLRLINLGDMAKKRLQQDGRDLECLELLKSVASSVDRGAHLAILEGGFAVYLLRVDAPGFFGPRIWPGKIQVPHFTAVGKALICCFDRAQLQEVLDMHQYSKGGTSKAIRTLEDLEEDLARVRERGYAIDDGEHDPEVRCLAAPIYLGRGRVVASIGVSCRANEVPLETLTEWGRTILRRHADKAAQNPLIVNALRRYLPQ
jgi:DNA-binding IclR family transcriptional regulator